MQHLQSLDKPHPLAWKRKGPLLPVHEVPVLGRGQSLCAECGKVESFQLQDVGCSLITMIVPKTPDCASGFRFFVFPTKPVQDALSTFVLRLPREIRSMIYEQLSDMFKAYSGAFVTSELQPGNGDVYMFDTGAWYSIRHFRGERINHTSILELEAAPWAHQNLAHLFQRTPARHLKALHPQLLDECVDDICMRAGHVRLSMQYRNHQSKLQYDALLFNKVAQQARQLTMTFSYHGICSARAPKFKASALGYGDEPANERLTFLNDLARIFQDGECRASVLNLNINFDIPFTEDCRLTVNEQWVQNQVSHKLSNLGCLINLCIYNRCDEQYQVKRDGYACPQWENIFSHQSSMDARTGLWSAWRKQPLSIYDVAALECH